jgi:hypothetical protein
MSYAMRFANATHHARQYVKTGTANLLPPLSPKGVAAASESNRILQN